MAVSVYFCLHPLAQKSFRLEVHVRLCECVCVFMSHICFVFWKISASDCSPSLRLCYGEKSGGRRTVAGAWQAKMGKEKAEKRRREMTLSWSDATIKLEQHRHMSKNEVFEYYSAIKVFQSFIKAAEVHSVASCRTGWTARRVWLNSLDRTHVCCSRWGSERMGRARMAWRCLSTAKSVEHKTGKAQARETGVNGFAWLR